MAHQQHTSGDIGWEVQVSRVRVDRDQVGGQWVGRSLGLIQHPRVDLDRVHFSGDPPHLPSQSQIACPDIEDDITRFQSVKYSLIRGLIVRGIHGFPCGIREDWFHSPTFYYLQSYFLRNNLLMKILPKKITQIKAPKSNPQRIPSTQPLDGITCQAINTAMATLVMVMVIKPLRMLIQG